MATDVQWSELQRDPKSVAVLADSGGVRVRRRDGATLLLTREDQVTACEQGALSVVRALRGLLLHLPPEAVAESLGDEFPWLELLPADVLPDFAADFVKAARVSAELGQWHTLAQTVREWKATAAVYADPTLLAQLIKPLNTDCGPVLDPAEC
ncbi:MAG: hypothetical protein ACRDPW_04830 [Mycobacteriales bacterium]